MLRIITSTLAGIVAIGSLALAQDNKSMETIYITGGKEKIRKQAGSAHMVEQKELEEFKHTDVNRVLEKVPGVNIQEEEGFGLRPNIGLRGAHPHRSRKVVLMEDGVLIAPAPYAAPAAYYFPAVARMSAVEVFKGPVAIKYGPNTIGGAVNMVSRPIPQSPLNLVDLSGGQFDFRKVQLTHGNTVGPWGYLLEGAHSYSEGFKKLDGGGNTGFDKNEALLKTRYTSTSENGPLNIYELKVSMAQELSHETYLGLTADDFKHNPYRRYRASQRDKMNWQHSLFQFSHIWEHNDVSVRTDIYRTDFDRVWSKLNGFKNGPDMREVLSNPIGVNKGYYDVITGKENSLSATGDDKIVIGNNDRSYYSQGLQVAVNWLWGTGSVQQEWEAGIRYHEDGITRNHTEDDFDMRSGTLVRDLTPRRDGAQNKDSAQAISLYALNNISWNDFVFSPGVRAEIVQNKRDDHSATNNDSSEEENILAPGFGIFYQWLPEIGFLAGVHKGYTLAGPGQEEGKDPEESINYEAGTRVAVGNAYMELIGFFNDYSNIKGTCSFSAGCKENDLDKEYSGGRADVYGAEAVISHTEQLWEGYQLPVTLNYTYTEAYFTERSPSQNVEWGVGTIEKGDPLPYIPTHKASLNVGIKSDVWGTNLSTQYNGMMYDQSVRANRQEIESHVVLDWAIHRKVAETGEVYGGVDNIFDESYVVSLRPFGARPGKPRMAKAGVKWQF